MNKFSNIENNSNKIKKLMEKLKRTEELNDIRLDIRELKKEVSKMNKKAFSDIDMLKVIALILLLILGFIIIKAFLAN